MAHLDFEAPLVELEERIAALKELTDGGAPEAEAIDAQIENLLAQAEDLQRKLYADLDVWKKVGTRTVPTCGTTWRSCSRTSSNCMGTETSGTIRRSFLDLHASKLKSLRSSATRRGGRRKTRRSETSGWHTPRATGKRSASCNWPSKPGVQC